MFDIVICVGPNDYEVITEQLKYTKKNIIGYRNIYLITPDTSIDIPECVTIDEKIFPFNMNTVIKYHGKMNRNGWYLQQLLKLYAGIVIPDILDKYLVIDADTFFLKPTTFINELGHCVYNRAVPKNRQRAEYHYPYFVHMKKLHTDFVKMERDISGICHHMIFETKYILEIFKLVESLHGDIFYNVFLKLVEPGRGVGARKSGASEYELYFNYMMKYHRDKIGLRYLEWCETGELIVNSGLDYISYHYHKRRK